MVIDTEHDHNTENTARRVAKMYLTEVFRGRYVKQPPMTEFPNVGHLNELMIVGRNYSAQRMQSSLLPGHRTDLDWYHAQ